MVANRSNRAHEEASSNDFQKLKVHLENSDARNLILIIGFKNGLGTVIDMKTEEGTI